MYTANTKLTAARAFIRSLNILLKYARLYSFDHTRTAEQFATAWNELHEAIPVTNESGLLLSASGSQLLLDGAPIESSPAERSFAQLLSAAGLASIQFTARVTKDDLERLVRAFPTHNTKPSVLAEQLKAALANVPGIRINQIRYVAEDASMGEARVAGLLTAQTLGLDSNSMRDWLSDPQKLLQLIAASEGSRAEPGGEGGGDGTGNGTGTSPYSGSGEGTGTGSGSGSGSGGGTGIGSGSGTGSGGGAGGAGGPGSGGLGGTGSGGVGTGGAGNSGVGNGGPGNGGTGGGGTGSGLSSGSGTGAGSGDGLSQRRNGPGGTGKFSKTLSGTGSGSTGGLGSGGSGGPNKTGSGFSAWSTKDEDILGILKLLTHLGHTVTSGGEGVQPGPLQEELTKLPAESQEMLRQALAAVAAQAPATNSKDPMLLRLAEHLAVRFALERYQRGEVKVNAVRQMIERMSQEIEGLRKILGAHEQTLADAGIIVESNADMLDRQFWAAVPDQGKRAVLTSSDAWCIPARNLRQYVEELIARNNEKDEKLALEILQNYASSIQNPENEARRRTAIGLADVADLYALLGGRPLAPAIQMAGAQLSLERDDNLQGMISAAFVRLAQEAGAKRMFPALLQALDSLDAVENQRPVFAQSLRPRIGLEKRVPEYLEEVLRGKSEVEGLDALLQRMPRTAAENLVLRFNRTANRVEMQRLADLARAVGNDVAASIRDTLRSGTPNEAAETVGLLSRLDPSCIERWAPDRLAEWPRNAQDRVVRLLAMSGAPERGSLMSGLLHLLDPVLLSLAIDEIGLSEDASCIPALYRLAEGDMNRSGGAFIRLKAVEALGRLKAQESAEMLKNIVESRHMFHWTHAAELRLAAVQSLAKIDSLWAREFLPRSGFSASDLSLAPLDPLPDAKYFRRRRYPRVRLAQSIPAIASTGQDSYRLEIRGLSLSGGIAVGEKHVQPGTLVSMKIGSGLRPIRARVLMRDARAQGLGFEIADMDLDERARLRKLLLENRSSTNTDERSVLAETTA
jgi:hypothetical protein